MSKALQLPPSFSEKENLLEELNNHAVFQSSMHESNLWNFTLHRSKLHEAGERESYLPDIQYFDNDESFMHKFWRVIEIHLSDTEFDVDRLSHEMKLSLEQLCNKLKNYTNESPAELIRNFRLQKAATLLAYSKDSVSEIACKTGFNDLSHFSKSFKKVFGICPSRYQTYEVLRYS